MLDKKSSTDNKTPSTTRTIPTKAPTTIEITKKKLKPQPSENPDVVCSLYMMFEVPSLLAFYAIKFNDFFYYKNHVYIVAGCFQKIQTGRSGTNGEKWDKYVACQK